MANCSSQDPALVGSIASKDCSVKRSDERPSKHYQTEVGRNDYSFYSSSPCIDGWNKSAIWAQNEDDSIKAEAAGWPSWETVSNRSCEKYSLPSNACKNDSTMASKMGWNESEDGNAKKVSGEGYDVIHHHDLDGRRPSSLNIHMVDTCGMSESACWDRQSDGSGKRETDRWPIWPGAISKATWQCNSHQNSTGIQSEEWTMSQDGSTMQCKSGWNDYVDGKEKRENDGDTFDRDGRNVWRQSRSNIHIVGKGSLSKSVSWDRAKYENAERENDGWCRWSGAMSKTNSQCCSHQNRKGYWNQSRGCITPEDGYSMSCKRGWNESGYQKQERENDGDAFDHDGRDRWRQWRSNIRVADKGGLSKSASWDQSKDENVKRKNDEWPRWSGATSKTTSEDDSSMAFRSGCNESENGKEKCKTADGSDAFDHDDHDGWKPTSSSICMVDKGSLSFSASWDQAKDDNTKRENDGWARWPGAMSKTFEQFPSHRNGKTISQSRGWTTSDDGDSQKETGGKNPDLGQSGEPWMQHDSVMLQNCDWNTPVSHSASKGDSLVRDQRKWDPGLDQSGGDPWKEIDLAAPPPKACRRKFRSETIAHGENSIRRKSKWSEQCLSSQNRKGGWNQSWRRITSEDGDFLKEINDSIIDLDQSDNRWTEHRPMILPKYDRKKSGSWTESGGDGFEADHMRWGSDFDHTGHDPWERANPSDSAAPDFSDPNALKQNINTFFSRIGGKRSFRGRNRTPYHGYEHEHYQSNDAYRKGRSVSAYYGDSPSRRSQRGSQIRLHIGDAVGKHPDRNTDESCDSKKAPCLRHDGRISFEDPWKQRDRSQAIVFWRHRRSHNNGEEKKCFHCFKPSQTKNSYPDGLIQRPASNPDDEAGNHQQQTMLKIPDSSTTQASTVYVSSSDPVFIQANEDPSFSNLCGKLPPTIIRQKASMNSEDVETRSKKLAPVEPSDKIFDTDTQFVKPEEASRICDFWSKSWRACHSETVDIQVNGQSNRSKYVKEEAGANEGFRGGMEDKGIRMFKFALAELVKEMLKPVWKEGRLSKEAHKTVVKKVVDKVVGVLGTNIPKTQQRIDLYLFYSKEKLHKLVQVNKAALFIYVRFGAQPTLSFLFFKIDGS